MKLSIITINYNNKAGLQKTIDSVMSQTWRDFEWIIIDGGSTDGSKEVIESVASYPNSNISYWCSEPDKGIYNAMNKGIVRASGDYLQFLNSGDCLADESVVEDFFKLLYKEEIIGGDLIVDSSKELVRCNPDNEDLDYDFMSGVGILHPSSFIKRSLFELYGGYDEKLKIVSDWKWFMEVTIKYNCSYRHWRRIVSDFNTEGISESEQMHELLLKEREQVKNAFLPRYKKSFDEKIQRINELDLPIGTLLKQRLSTKIMKWLRIQ